MEQERQITTQVANQRTIKWLLVVVVAMFGFGYALVPIYDVFCEITGINGKTGRISEQTAQNMEIDPHRMITVEFVANINADLPWEFKPLQTKLEVHPGQTGTVSYVASNKSDRDIIGQAIPSVAPGIAALYFSKTECFCFTQQLLKAGETKEMPVRFIIDPRLPENISTVTLSYTFFESLQNKKSPS
ncbi:MAG: cytochrome c oxidase assembly protein [Beggiatoa sp. IS2]|nr:MAG: cytochrome c oxidase assembly protein [Beggiatoa sp. IS2]